MQLLLAALVLSQTVTAWADEPPAPKKIRSIEGITEYHLDNGMKILLFPDASKPKVTVNLTILVGSRHEGYGEAGMAHLLEHMLFKGTEKHQDIPKLLNSRGATRVNGTTWLDRTNYYETLPASEKNLEFALRLEADRMMNSLIKAEDLESEMTVVRNEFERGENSSFRVLGQRMLSAAFEWHNYGRATIGNRADIERVPVERLRVFYEKYYQPDNAILIVAGQFEEQKALELAHKYFAVIPRPKRVLESTYTEEPAQDGERAVTIRRVGKESATGAVFHIPSGAHPDYAAIEILSNILMSQPSGPLYKSLVETKLASGAYAFAYNLHDPGFMKLHVTVNPGNDARDVLNRMIDTLDEVVSDGVTDEEVKRAIGSLQKKIEVDDADTSSSAIALSEWAAQGDWRLKFLYRDRIEKVTAADVQRVAKQYLRSDNRTVGLYLPVEKAKRISIPETPNLVEMIGDYKGRGAVAAGEVFEASPENIEARTVRTKLADNVDAAFLSKKNRGETVSLKIYLRYGTPKTLDGLKSETEFLPALMRRGTKKMSRQEIQDALDKYKASISTSGDPGLATFTVSAKRSDFLKVIEILKQIMREPALPEAELEIIRQGQVTAITQRMSDPQTLAIRKLRRAFRPFKPGDPRYEPTLEEELERVKAVSLKTLAKLHSDFFCARGQVAVVGDFDLEATKAALTDVFADWEPMHEFARIKHRGDLKPKPQTVKIEVPDKPNAMYISGFVFEMDDTDEQFPALVVGNYILGGGSLSSRLADRVRQKDGLSYFVAAYFSARALDKRGSFTSMAICNPANIGKVQTAIKEEIASLVKDGITDEELTNAKKGLLDGQDVGRSDDSSLASMLATRLYLKRTMMFDKTYEANIAKTSKEQVNAALKKYFNPKQLFVVISGDFSKPAETETPKEKSE
ncbi:MAG: pseudouridine synthase [Planctomycetaceae bacterium]|nr:pseudouridine synthase [Planctomycetaceae bacterium]